jgi:Na+:H+ antiporter, NhaA family
VQSHDYVKVASGEPGSLVGGREACQQTESPVKSQPPRPSSSSSGPLRLLQRPSWPEAGRVANVLRTETVGGFLLLAGAAAAVAWANSPWAHVYEAMRAFVPVPGAAVVGLDLDLEHWAADGLLAIFFFVVALELKREFVVGDLRKPARAALPVLAAVGGMAIPGLIYVLLNLNAGGDALRGWAIPTATDIAFAVAILAVISSHLPSGLRAFLLTLAVVDDLLAIIVIAVFYTEQLSFLPLLAAIVPVGLFGLLLRRGKTCWWLLLPLALAAWVLMHASGVHATIAGVMLGLVVPVAARRDSSVGLAEHLEHIWRPVSAGVAVPVFALFTAGVPLGVGVIGSVFHDTVGLGIVLGLIVGKVVGILGTSYFLARFTRAQLADDLTWTDMLGVALLGGIGFTVSLLIGGLAFGEDSGRGELVTTAVLLASVLSAGLASVVLVARNRVYRRLHAAEVRDENRDGVPDIYQEGGQSSE